MRGEWEADDRVQLECVQAGPYELRKGDRVRLVPRRRADIMDIALQGKVATIEAIEQDLEKRLHLAVVLQDDPAPTWATRGRSATASSSRPTKSNRWPPAGTIPNTIPGNKLRIGKPALLDCQRPAMAATGGCVARPP